jgi:two-component system sensor histidine kinase KdpD
VQVSAEAGPGSVLVRIADRGPGISEADREHIFEPFFQGAAGHADHRGSGLGLAIVKGFVEANGGRVWAEPTPGNGATFVIELPIERTQAEEPNGAE